MAVSPKGIQGLPDDPWFIVREKTKQFHVIYSPAKEKEYVIVSVC